MEWTCFNCRIKLEQFEFPEGGNGDCGTDTFVVSSLETGNLSSVDSRQQICGHKEGMESKKLPLLPYTHTF